MASETQSRGGIVARLLNNELKIRSKKYLVQSSSYAEMLEATTRFMTPPGDMMQVCRQQVGVYLST